MLSQHIGLIIVPCHNRKVNMYIAHRASQVNEGKTTLTNLKTLKRNTVNIRI